MTFSKKFNIRINKNKILALILTSDPCHIKPHLYYLPEDLLGSLCAFYQNSGSVIPINWSRVIR